MNIISKFVVGSEYGVDLLFELKEAQLRNLYENTEKTEKITLFIENELDRRATINQLNDLTTQLIIAFENDKALGYAMIKNSYNRPSAIEAEKAVELFFYILPEYQHAGVFEALWQKCLSVTRNYSYWTEILQNDVLLLAWQSCGFRISEESVWKPFDLKSYILVKSETPI